MQINANFNCNYAKKFLFPKTTYKNNEVALCHLVAEDLVNVVD